MRFLPQLPETRAKPAWQQAPPSFQLSNKRPGVDGDDGIGGIPGMIIILNAMLIVVSGKLEVGRLLFQKCISFLSNVWEGRSGGSLVASQRNSKYFYSIFQERKQSSTSAAKPGRLLMGGHLHPLVQHRLVVISRNKQVMHQKRTGKHSAMLL